MVSYEKPTYVEPEWHGYALKAEPVLTYVKKAPSQKLAVKVGESSLDEFPPIMREVARCESNSRQFHENGEVVRGHYDNQDIGLFQISLRYHKERTEELGIDVFTKEGNIEYAKMLYEEQGTTPWNASKECWSS